MQYVFRVICTHALVQSLNRSHGGLDVQTLDVLPVLLEQRHQEVHGQVNVLDQFLFSHANIADSNTQAENLLHLELDGGLQVQGLGLQVVAVGDQGGELSGLKKEKVDHSILLHKIMITLLRPGPNNLGICLIKVSEAMKASYLAASFLTFFLSLFSFLRSSADMASMPRDLASSMCC